MTRLALLRHGHTAWNRAGRIQGRTDIALDDAAAQDLAALRMPSPWDEATLWSSPLLRAAHTATLVTGAKPQFTEALMEMNWGEWEGQTGKVLHADLTSGFKDIEQWGWNYTPPNGESPDALRRRLIPWIATLRGDNIAVCHIGVMRVLMAIATGWEFEGPAPFQVKRNRLYIITIDAADWQLDAEPERLIERLP